MSSDSPKRSDDSYVIDNGIIYQDQNHVYYYNNPESASEEEIPGDCEQENDVDFQGVFDSEVDMDLIHNVSQIFNTLFSKTVPLVITDPKYEINQNHSFLFEGE